MQCLLEESKRSPKERTPTVYKHDKFWAELRTKLAERHAPLSQPRNQEGFMCFPPMTHPSLPPLLDSKGHLPVNCQRSVSTKSYQWHPVLKTMSRTDTIPMNIRWLPWWFWKCYSPNALCQLYPQKKHSKLDKQRKQNEMLSLFALCSSFSWKFSQEWHQGLGKAKASHQI